MTDLRLEVVNRDGRLAEVEYRVRRLLLAGYTGRDRGSVLAHIHELEALGVAPPPRVPMVYDVDPSLLTTASNILVHGARTSGEVEFFLVPIDDTWLVGLGSDHTDREHEAIDVAMSKGFCPKPICQRVWRYADIREHWDELVIRAWVTEHGDRRLYQESQLSAFLTVDDLLASVRGAGHADLRGAVVFGGTVATRGGLSFGSRFEIELYDPRLDRSLRHAYDVEVAGTAVR
jgi:hypothetical protein